MSTPDELDRIRSEYSRRATDPRLANLYTALNPADLFAIQSRERALIRLLRAEGMTSLSELRLLDLGCGSGGELCRFLGYGASPSNMYGIDLLDDRLVVAHQLSPHLGFAQGDASRLPYTDATFDIILQFTVFSSILGSALKCCIAAEMLRVLKPGGLIVWYDFWWNPINPATRGVRPAEIRKLFPGCRYEVRLITLAPPIARRVVPVSWLAGYLLERLPFLRTHYLVGIRKREKHHA
jgi:ubiquinone/menaquinone biosynthesis C-methylase UbiE